MLEDRYANDTKSFRIELPAIGRSFQTRILPDILVEVG